MIAWMHSQELSSSLQLVSSDLASKHNKVLRFAHYSSSACLGPRLTFGTSELLLLTSLVSYMPLVVLTCYVNFFVVKTLSL